MVCTWLCFSGLDKMYSHWMLPVTHPKKEKKRFLEINKKLALDFMGL